MERRTHSLSEQELMDRLVHQNHCTPEELSQATGIPVYAIQHAAHTGELRAFVVKHHCLDILREDALAWLRRSGPPATRA